jgi:hypothetical protein
MDRREWQVIVGTACFLFLVVAILLAANAPIVRLFEDGSIQFFNDPRFGYCLLPGWGCTP